jgi:hypothetical protein
MSPASRNYALGVLMLAYTANYVNRQILSILLQPIKLELGLSDTAIAGIGPDRDRNTERRIEQREGDAGKEARSSCHPFVSMMKSADLRKCDDAPNRSRLDTPGPRSILRESQMGSCTVVMSLKRRRSAVVH